MKRTANENRIHGFDFVLGDVMPSLSHGHAPQFPEAEFQAASFRAVNPLPS